MQLGNGKQSEIITRHLRIWEIFGNSFESNKTKITDELFFFRLYKNNLLIYFLYERIT
jgi:hypothetical protein